MKAQQIVNHIFDNNLNRQEATRFLEVKLQDETELINLLWLDDLRNPYLDEEGKLPTNQNGEYNNINWVLNFNQFVKWIEVYGLPDIVSFDHDLAAEHYTPAYFWNDYEESKKFQTWKSAEYKHETGLDCAKWLVDYCTKHQLQLPKFHVHSANPVGADNIKLVLNQFKQ